MVVEPIGLDAQGYFLEKIKQSMDALDDALASVGTDKLRVSVVDALPESPFNITKVSGTSLTGRDWSGDFAKLQNLDVSLSTRASESTLSSVLSKLDELDDALTSVGTDKLLVTPDNPPNLDVSLSTRASESTLSALSGKFPSASALGDSLSNPTTTIIGSALLGWDSAGGVWERLKTDGSGRLLLWLG